MTAHDQPIYELIREIRAAFNALKAVSDAMVADLGVTAAMRAVLEHLDREGPATVPQIAKAKTVSRQHIQVLADALAEKGLLRFAENPGHKRSKLMDLTPEGRKLFSEIKAREAAELQRLGATLAAGDLTAAAALLRRLRAALPEENAQAADGTCRAAKPQT